MTRHSIITVTTKIGGWLGVDLGYYVRNNAYLLATQGVILLCGLASSIVLTRLLPKETYGQYNFFLSILTLLGIFALPGMTTAITQAVANDHDRVLIQGTKIRLKWSVIGAVGCLFVGLYYYSNGETLLAKCFMASALLLPFYVSLDTFLAFQYGRRQFDKAFQYRSISQVSITLGVVIAAYLTRNLLWIVLANLVSMVLFNALFFTRTVTAGKLNNSEDKTAIKYGKHLTPLLAIGLLTIHYQKIIIAPVLGFSELAIYSIAWMISDLAKQPIMAISASIFPKLAAMDETTATRELKTRVPWLVILSFATCGIAAFLCPYVIPLFYSQKYLASIPYTWLLLISVIVGTPALILRQALFRAQRKTKELYKINVAAAIVGTGLMTALVLRFGLLGLVISNIILEAFSTAYSWKLAQ